MVEEILLLLLLEIGSHVRILLHRSPFAHDHTSPMARVFLLSPPLCTPHPRPHASTQPYDTALHLGLYLREMVPVSAEGREGLGLAAASPQPPHPHASSSPAWLPAKHTEHVTTPVHKHVNEELMLCSVVGVAWLPWLSMLA